MKKASWLAVLCAFFIILLGSCGGGDHLRRLSFSYPLNIRAYLKFDGRDYEVDVTVTAENDMRISFSAPEMLKDTVLEMRGGECFMHVMGITLPIVDGGYSQENGLFLIRHLFDISKENYTNASVIKSGGVKYCVENYSTSLGRISAFFASDKPFPDRICATLRGHEIDLTIVNE